MDEFNHGKIVETNLSREMKTSFLSYAMSVIVSRALPDVRDGLKPVHRRILFSMNELKNFSNQPHKKSARIVGEVMGKYHPHGDSSIYEAMVRMAQPFSYRYPLVDGHGNFGSVDGDGAAAMRYTEARMSKIAMEMLRDLDKETVDFIDNYDGKEKEPVVLPSRIPQLLVNGATGIAVGMATNIPPHNLGEVFEGILALMDNPELNNMDLMKYIKGPDFPTGGCIIGYNGLVQAYETGNGTIIVRAKAEIVEGEHNKSSIIITEIPYQVNKTKLIERIAEIAKDKIVEGITDLRDESNRKGMRIVIDLRRDVNPNVMLNNLFKYTQLQTSYGINMIGLVNGQPKKLSLKEILRCYIAHQFEVITRRTEYDLRQSLDKLHRLEGYIIALDNIDEVINIIRNTNDGTEKEKLMSKFSLSDIQAQAILDMQLRRLSGLSREKTIQEYNELKVLVEEYNSILASEEKKHQVIKNEIIEIKDKYKSERVSEISLDIDLTIENEDLIPVNDVIVTITNNGYAKRMNLDTYKTQNRGGTGLTGIKTHEDDFVVHSIISSTHDYLLFFSNKGKVYKKKGYEIVEGSRGAKGIPLVNLLNFDSDESLAAISNIKNFDDEESFLLFITKKGIIKKTPVSEYKNIRNNGIIAIGLREDDELFKVVLTDDSYDYVLGSSNGKAIRFSGKSVRPISRTASGVKGIELEEDSNVVGGCTVKTEDEQILVITENGFGKCTKADTYRTQSRGGKGVKTLNATEKTGKLSTLCTVTDNDAIIVTTDKGMVIRMNVSQIPTIGRNTQGVKLIRLKESQKVSTITIVAKEENEDSDGIIVEQVNNE